MKYVMDVEGKPWRRFFEDLCAIPHESFNEKAVSDYIVNFAKERGLWYHQDEIWNVIVKKPASPGYENHPPVMIQGHTDMVCEKTPGSPFNFATDPLQLYVKDGWLAAKDTTLGADCGHGIAYMLAVLDDKTLKHPPVECFFSVQEETGIGGPRFVDYSLFKAKKIINTDMMSEGETVCATGNVVGGTFLKSLASVPARDLPVYQLHVGGGAGGHAAMNIIEEHVNAIKASAQVLFQYMKKFKVNIVSYLGGRHPQKNNIPTDAFVTFVCADGSFDELKAITAAFEAELKVEHDVSDPNLYIELKKAEPEKRMYDDLSTKGMVELILVLPTGIFSRSQSVPGFPTGSRNMGTLLIEDEHLKIGYMFRGALKSIIWKYIDETFTLAERFGAVYDEEYRYSGIYDKEDTPLKKLYNEVYKEATGKDIVVRYIHGGTDLGTIVDNIGDTDNVTIGPNTLEIHRPGERMEIASFDRVYGYLLTMLERL